MLLSIAGHAAALHGTEFTVDDREIVEHNARLVVGSAGDAWRLVSTSYWGEVYRAERLWRPVVLVSFALDRAAFGVHPDLSRAVSVGLHAATGVLALVLFGRLLGSRRAALAGALLFALHPVHAEATAGVVGRAEVLALLLALAGTLLHLRARARGWAPGYVLAAGAFLLASGSKEVALTAPFVLALVERVVGAPGLEAEPGWRRARRLAAPYALHALAIAAYLAARVAVLGGFSPPAEAQAIGPLPLASRVLVAAGTAGDAVRALVTPQVTAAIHPFTKHAWVDPGVAWRDAWAVTLLVAHAGLALAALVALRRPDRTLRAVGLGALAFYMTLGPSLNLVPIGVVFADRLVYTPSVWGCLVAAGAAHLALRGLAPRPRALLWTALLAPALAFCAWRLTHNAHAWSHERALWESTLRRYPDDAPFGQGHYGLGRVLLRDARDARDLDLAAACLERAVAGAGDRAKHAASARAALASILHRRGRSADALALLEQARRLRPEDDLTLFELVRVRFDRARALRDADPAAAEALLRQAERDARAATYALPHRYELWLFRGMVLQALEGRALDAEQAYDRAVERRADPWQALINRGVLREARGARDAALADYRAAAATLRARPRPTAEEATFLRAAMLHAADLDDPDARAWLQAHEPALLRELDARRTGPAGP